MTDAGEQPADFAILAFRQRNFQHRALTTIADPPHIPHPELALGKIEPLLQRSENLHGRLPGDQHAVTALDLKFGMGQPVAEFSIVGDEQQAFRIFIQPTDGEQPAEIFRNQINRLVAIGRIKRRADNVFRLIQP